MKCDTLSNGTLDGHLCSGVLLDSGGSSRAPRTATSTDARAPWTQSTAFAKTARHLCSFSQALSLLLLRHISAAQTPQRQVRASAIQTCSHGQQSLTASGDSGGTRRGGGRRCLMHKASVRHADNLLVLQGGRQKRHDITHRSVILLTCSPYRRREQRQLCARSRETMRHVAVYQPHRPHITHHHKAQAVFALPRWASAFSHKGLGCSS
ncbi:hypothetical protein TRVL_04766 [Trypanosoma vivax]|nr:hypothetical protein TRVL_04766 [Trypanosoma vivax]